MTRKTFLLLAGLLLVTSIAPGCGHLISREQEIQLGLDAAPQFEAEFGGPVENEQLQSYIRSIGAKLAAASDRDMPYEYMLLKSDVINAFALPGGKVYITAGLFRQIENERELAGVLGHETAHIARKHSVKQIEKAVGFEILLEATGYAAGSEAQAVGKVVASLITLKYSRKDEYEADQSGITFMTKAGYNPWGMVELLETLQSLQESEGDSVSEIFSTHPLTRKRIDEAAAVIYKDYQQYSAEEPDSKTGQFKEMKALLR